MPSQSPKTSWTISAIDLRTKVDTSSNCPLKGTSLEPHKLLGTFRNRVLLKARKSWDKESAARKTLVIANLPQNLPPKSVMATMRALYQEAHGDLSTFRLGDIPKPSPGEGQVLLKVHAAALNPVDVKRGNPEDSFPIVIGYDVAGVVESLGSGDICGLSLGDRVFGDVMAVSLGPKVTGSIAEYCVCNANLLARIPDGGSFESYAALPVAGGTAIEGLELANVQQGDKLFISGGAGGVGIHAMQIAKVKFGVSEVATTASKGKFEIVEKYGADRIVDYKSEDAGEVLKEWADAVFDCTAETDMAKKIVKPGGQIISIAAFGVSGVKSFPFTPTAERMQSLAEMVAAGTLVPVIDTIYQFEDACKAVQHIKGGRSTGKVVVRVSS